MKLFRKQGQSEMDPSAKTEPLLIPARQKKQLSRTSYCAASCAIFPNPLNKPIQLSRELNRISCVE